MRFLLVALTAAVVTAFAGSASAEPAVDSATVAVSEFSSSKRSVGYAGAFGCGAGVLWVDRRAGRATLWSDLKIADGKHSENSYRLRVPRSGTPVVGDFDGDGCADLLLLPKRGAKAQLRWGSSSGLGALQRISLAAATTSVVARLSGARDSLIAGGTAWLATGKRSRPFKRGKLAKGLSARPGAVVFADAVSGQALLLGKKGVTPLVLRGSTVRGRRALKLSVRRGARAAGCGPRAVLDLPGSSRDREIQIEAGGRPQTRKVKLPGAGAVSGAPLANGGCVLVRSGHKRGKAEIRLIEPPANPGGPTNPVEHPFTYMNSANRSRLSALLSNADPAAVRFRNMVDNAVDGTNYYGYEAWFSALMGAITGEAKYCADAVARTETWVVGEEALIAAGQRAEVAGDSYLEIGGYIGSLAMTFDWCYSSLSAAQRTRWINYANQAVWNVWHHEDAVWGGVAYPWSGWSVDNPANNYYYSFLRATMLLGLATQQDNPLAATWLTKFREEKIGNQLIPMFNAQLSGGGSREGTGYGTAMKGLFALYDIWEASTGERIADLTPHTKASIPYLMHETVASLDRIAPIGDHARDSTAALFDYHREYGLLLAWLYRDDPLASPLRGWLASNAVPQMGNYFEYVHDFLYRDPGQPSTALSTLGTSYFASGVGDLFSRSSWATDATWMSMRMGPYTESHAHHDQLSFLINRDGWLAYDANIDSHSGIEQSEEMHNLVRIEHGGTQRRQREGYSSTVQALADNAAFTYAAADATALYDPNFVNLVQREVVFLKPNTFVIYDRVNAGAGSTFTWQLSSPIEPVAAAGTATYGSPAAMRVRTIVPAAVTQSVVDLEALPGDEFSGGYRYEAAQSSGGTANFLTVIDLGDAVSETNYFNGPGEDEVQIGFTGGGAATLTFPRTGTGGNLTLTGAAGSYIGALPTGIQSLPLFAP